jgi:hypothetical protein
MARKIRMTHVFFLRSLFIDAIYVSTRAITIRNILFLSFSFVFFSREKRNAGDDKHIKIQMDVNDSTTTCGCIHV